MPKADREHFDQYTSQTRAKHAILNGYLPAYLRALKNRVAWFHYIDGFAGRGKYIGTEFGSPLLAMSIIEKEGLSDRSSISLVEPNLKFYAELIQHVSSHPTSNNFLAPPLIRHGRFSEWMPEILGRKMYGATGTVATFAFVDPCGVDGVKLSNLVDLLNLDFGEVLLFFNYDAVNRLLGGLSAGTHDDRVLSELFGDSMTVADLVRQLSETNSSNIRERTIRNCFIGALRRQSGARFFVPFRFESKDKDRTSHYLIHCCDHPLGFKIMKHVMWELVRAGGDEYGRLEFLRDNERGSQFELFRPDIESQKQRILERIARGNVRVREFSVNWMNRPSDPFSEKMYKTMLMELEQQGKLAVFDKDNVELSPSTKRRAKSLGDDYWLRLPS